MYFAFSFFPVWARSHVSALLLAFGSWTLCGPAAFAAPPQVIPCATDQNGHPVSFNSANSGHEYSCEITITANTDGSEDVLIHQPVVDDPHRFFEYKQITFSPGDIVTFTADGCVQTGGSGRTWKRYLNPSGSNSGPPNGLYFGTVKIPFAQLANGPLTENTPLASITPPIPVPGLGPQKIFIPSLPNFPNVSSINLVLGYVDDNPTDAGGNGYWGHDDGNNDQCANTSPSAPAGQFGGPAFVKLHVIHDKTNPFGSVVHKDWDLVGHGLDINGLPLNPEWGWQINGGLQTSTGLQLLGPEPPAFPVGCPPACTSQNPSFDEAGLTWGNAINHFIPGVCQHYDPPQNYNPWTASGHLNWFDATYTGQIFWVTHDGGAFGDDDYNMRLLTPVFHRDPAGTTLHNVDKNNAPDEKSVGIEFDSDETIDHYTRNAFWTSFHQTVDRSDAAAGAIINNHDAVVIGLMGFDEMHDVYTEIHPVHALAIRESSPADAADDRWFFFARNWGDEGECSHLQHFLLSNQITLQLPAPSTQENVATLNTAATQVFGNSGATAPPTFFSGSQGTFVTFTLPSSEGQPYVYGEVSLNWTGKPSGSGDRRSISQRASVDLPIRPVAAPPEEDADEGAAPERRLRNMLNSTPPERQMLYRTILAALYVPRAMPPDTPLTMEVSQRPPTRPQTFPAHASIQADEKLKRDSARMQAMCAANDGRIPSEPKWCEVFKAPPITLASVGANGTVALTAYDSAGSGIGKTEYSFDGTNWSPYSSPVTLPAGVFTLYHRATDKLGTVENIRRIRAGVASRASLSDK